MYIVVFQSLMCIVERSNAFLLWIKCFTHVVVVDVLYAFLSQYYLNIIVRT